MRRSATRSITRLRLLRLALGLCVGHCTAATAQAQVQDTVVYYHTDAIGSVRVITDANGQVLSRHDYLPFGEAWAPLLAADVRQFAGKERDKETGLDYFGARYYSTAIGRFTTSDQVLHPGKAALNPQLWNKYAYVSNNPLRKVDPDGRWEREVHYDLTRLLAIAAGFDRVAAREIADWNQRADTDTDKTPMTAFSTEQRELYHFTTLERRMQLARAAVVPGNLRELGLFLHAEQDSFSHLSYGPLVGHFFAGHRPDQTWVNTRAADAMAADSYAWLVHARTAGTAIPWDKLAPFVRRFNSAVSPTLKEQRLKELHRFIDEYDASRSDR
jgi:RHS repeat-associated protein